MLKALVEAAARGKLLAVQIILIGALAVGVMLSLAGKPEQAASIIVPVFITEGLLFAIKRELGVFGLPLSFE
jgi:hypothetical protein